MPANGRWDLIRRLKVKHGLERVKIKISLWGQHLSVCVCVRACIPFQLWNDKREGSRMPMVTVGPLYSTFANGLRKTLHYYPYTFSPVIIFSRCTIIIVIIITILTRTVIYINSLILQSGLSENMFRSSPRDCLLVFLVIKDMFIWAIQGDIVLYQKLRRDTLYSI